MIHQPSPINHSASLRGFTLIEVCLAVLIIGFGLVSIFGLFPSGLRSMEDDTADTRSGLFTESVMQGMRANASTIMDWADWTNAATFSGSIVSNVLYSGSAQTGSVQAIRFPANGDWLRYKLTITAQSGTNSAMLEVCDGQYGAFDPPQSVAYTEFYYQGM